MLPQLTSGEPPRPAPASVGKPSSKGNQQIISPEMPELQMMATSGRPSALLVSGNRRRLFQVGNIQQAATSQVTVSDLNCLLWSCESLGVGLHGDLELFSPTLQCSFFHKNGLSTLIAPVQGRVLALAARSRRCREPALNRMPTPASSSVRGKSVPELSDLHSKLLVELLQQ